MSLKANVLINQNSLDMFNLEVAQFRVMHGMSTQMIHLYGAMGRLSKILIALEEDANEVERLWGNVTSSFQLMKDKEEK